MLPQWQKILEPLFNSVRQHLKDEKSRVNLLIVLGLGGMLLLCLSEWMPDSTPAVQSSTAPTTTTSAGEDNAAYIQQLEQRLQTLLEDVDGAGRCSVMVTLASGEETVYATDLEQGETTSRSEHVILGEEALVERVQPPTIQGVAVLCEGGDDSSVQNAVTELVRALTGVGANHITVEKMVAAQQ